MAVTKKRAFERWVEKSFRTRFNQETQKIKRFARERFIRTWREWLTLETTHQAVVPFVVAVFLAGFTGWSMGVANNNCSPIFTPSDQTSFM